MTNPTPDNSIVVPAPKEGCRIVALFPAKDGHILTVSVDLCTADGFDELLPEFKHHILRNLP